MNSQSQVLKAYHVQGEEYGLVRFATCNIVARREGAQALNEEFRDMSCKRMPGADKYAELGKVPVRALVEEFGWWQECAYCNCHVNNDTEGRVWSEDTAYCDSECEARFIDSQKNHEAELLLNKENESAAIDAALTKFPGISDITALTRYNKDITVFFRFPGGLERATWVFGTDNVGTAPSDAEAFKAYLESNRTARQTADYER